jgi:septal ring factor EnvC (AmiA/AmiB activator)
MLTRVSSAICCFSKTACEEKQKRVELESEVLALKAQLSAAEKDKKALIAAAEAEKTALMKHLDEEKTKQDDLLNVIEKVQAENEDLRLSPVSIRRTVALKVRKLSTSSPFRGTKDKDATLSESTSADSLAAPAN